MKHIFKAFMLFSHYNFKAYEHMKNDWGNGDTAWIWGLYTR